MLTTLSCTKCLGSREGRKVGPGETSASSWESPCCLAGSISNSFNGNSCYRSLLLPLSLSFLDAARLWVLLCAQQLALDSISFLSLPWCRVPFPGAGAWKLSGAEWNVHFLCLERCFPSFGRLTTFGSSFCFSAWEIAFLQPRQEVCWMKKSLLATFLIAKSKYSVPKVIGKGFF